MDEPRVAAAPRRQAALVLIGSVLVTTGMSWIPSPETTWWLLAPFRWLHIYVHEYGHGVAALISGGRFESFEMYSYSGVAHTYPTGNFAQAFVCAGGLCGPAVLGALFLAIGRDARRARIGLGAFGAVVALSLVLWTRTWFGWGFGAVLAAGCLLVAARAKPGFAQATMVFLGVQLALSVYTGGGYLFVRNVTIQSGYAGPSDTEIMSLSIGLPYWFWGICCALFSVVALVWGIRAYLRPASPAGA